MNYRPTGFLPSHLQHQAKGKGRHGPIRMANGLMVRGVVVNVYQPNDPLLATHRSKLKLLVPTVTCDVLVYEPDFATMLRDVPIVRQSAGVVDSELWVPRGSSISLLGGVLTTDGSGPLVPASFVTEPKDMDGDHVIVGFMANDLMQPVILGQIDHPANIRTPLATAVSQFKYRRSIRGWSIGMRTTGNIEIDGTLASVGAVTPTTPAVETPAPAAGNIDLVMSATALLKVSLLLSTSVTREPPVLGTTFLTQLQTMLTSEQTAWTRIATDRSAGAAAHTAYSAAFTSLGEAAAATAATAAATAATLAATGAAAQAAAIGVVLASIATSLSAGKPFLSVTTEVD